MSFAFVFPGQGSESLGMLADFAGESVVRNTFTEAAAVLGYDLWQLIQAGPLQRLSATECTQPALLTAGVALWRCWLQRGGRPPAQLAGHSLGEFTALVCAGALELAAAVALVRYRGEVMQAAVPRGTGAMAAILGLDDAEVGAACREAAQGEVVEAVNFNAPGQVVIAGASAAVERAIAAAKSRGAKRAIALSVSVPSHSSLMLPAAAKLAARLASVPLSAPQIPCMSAVDAAFHEDPAEIRRLLVRQLASPVHWQEVVRKLGRGGIAQVIECGPGRILTGLNRRIERRADLAFLALEDRASLDAALAATADPVTAAGAVPRGASAATAAAPAAAGAVPGAKPTAGA